MESMGKKPRQRRSFTPKTTTAKTSNESPDMAIKPVRATQSGGRGGSIAAALGRGR